MKKVVYSLFVVLSCLACTSSEITSTVTLAVEIGPLCPVANVNDVTPCGLSNTELNEIYSSYSAKVFSSSDNSKLFYNAALTYPANIQVTLPFDQYTIEVSNAGKAITVNPNSFSVNSTNTGVITINVDTGIR